LLAARRGASELARLLRRLGPDVLHVSNGGYPGSHSARGAAFVTRAKKVMTINCKPQDRKGGIRGAYRVLDPLVWRALDHIVCPAEATAEGLIRARGCPPEQI